MSEAERYRILRKLGEGGMGEVFLAEHVALGRREAIKVLHPALAGEREFLRRFRREARANNRVQHPNIVSVYDFGQLPDGRFFLAMEFVEGVRLDQTLKAAGRLAAPRAVHILRQLADATRHAHEHGVVHRDLKPANLLLVDRGSGYGNPLRSRPDTLKVLDFGIAKIIAPDYHETGVLTLKGHVFGTPAYIAPEQWQGAAAHPTLDIYALGCIAYEMLAGQPLFAGRRMEVMHAHLTAAPPPLGKLRADLPPGLEEIVMRCLMKDPGQRFASTAELQSALLAVERAGQPARRRPLTDFDGIDTVDDSGRSRALSDLGSADTDRAVHPRVDPRDALRFRAETLLDQGPSHPQLTLALSRIHALEDERHRADLRAEALEHEADAIEQAGREREAALRFAIGELAFERDQLAPADPIRAELDAEMSELDGRLGAIAVDAGQQLRAVTDHQVALVARAAAVEESLGETYATLERLIKAGRRA